MSKWSDYYKSRVGNSYINYCTFRYFPLIKELERREPNFYAEEGCGIGTISIILSKRQPDRELLLSDNDMDVLKLCKQNVWKYRDDFCNLSKDFGKPDGLMWSSRPVYHINVQTGIRSVRPNILVMHDDLMRQPKYDVPADSVVFGHGVLEHFDDWSIKHILSRQKQESQKVVHYVPTDKYIKPSIGCERLLPTKWWVDTWRPTRHEVFNEGKDLILTWEQKAP